MGCQSHQVSHRVEAECVEVCSEWALINLVLEFYLSVLRTPLSVCGIQLVPIKVVFVLGNSQKLL